MKPDEDLEQGIQALLDGRPLSLTGGPPNDVGVIDTPLRVIDAIARAHRTAIFGKDAPLDRPASTTWGHLEVRGEIGRGASGTVYRAWDTRLAREVALKLFAVDVAPGDALEEGRLLARLNHAHIVRVFGADTHDGVAGIWMELLEGETLDEILARDGVFSAEEALLIGQDLARALSAVHAAGLLHRDVKARNIVSERGGRVVLMDLGAGRTTDRAAGRGDGAGTPMYMAPEVLQGGPASVRSDIYCLGIVLYRLLTGAFPVTSTDLAGLRAAHSAGRRVSLDSRRPDLPRDLVTIIERASGPDAGARYASAAEFEGALSDTLRRTLSERAAVAPAITRVWSRWRKRVQIAAAITVLAALTVWGGWNSTAGRATRRALGMAVPPRSTLYMTLNGGLALLRDGTLTLVPHNPTTATVMAVSSDLGIVTMSAIPPWIPGGRFRLDGTHIGSPPMIDKPMCCFNDGTTDGRFNYAARNDTTLLEPIGSRPLAPPGVYRFTRDWTSPELLFPLAPNSFYFGITYSSASNSFWLTRRTSDGSAIDQWSRDGKLLSTPVSVPGALFMGIAVDPDDGSLWVLRERRGGVTMRLENFDRDGRHLTTLDMQRSYINTLPLANNESGLEFEWVHGT